MTAGRPRTVVTDVVTALSVDPSRPRLTGHTAQGRTELSGTALLNWASKTAGLLVDELGVTAGDLVEVRTPPHWQTAGILLGAWWAGLAVTDDPDERAVAAFVPPGGDSDAEEVFVVSGHPLGLGLRDLPAHRRDYTTAVLGQADVFRPRRSADPELVTRTAGADLPAAVFGDALRAPSGLRSGQRVLTAGPWSLDGGPPGVIRLLLRPLLAGASVIHSTDLDPAGDGAAWAHRAAVERADLTLGVDVPGLPRLG